MKLCGIIAEFNPFTNGHSFIISEAKQKTGLDILCLMSGNLVQRGELAITNKYQRATTAIREGASFVIELPTRFAISSAQNFAEGAIKTLKELGCVSHLAFGVKIKEINDLKKIAKIKANEPKIVKDKFKEYTKLGLNYNNAIFKVYNELFPEFSKTLSIIQSEPNNILALEYLTAIYKFKADIEPVFIERTDYGYNSLNPIKVKFNGKKVYFVSASKIRKLIKENKKIYKFTPKSSHNDFKNLDSLSNPSIKAKFEAVLIESIRNKSYEELEQLYDYDKNLAHSIKDACQNFGTIDKIVESLTTKCYRPKRIKKLLIYPFLNLTKEKYLYADENKYLNVLSVDKTKKINLTKIVKSSTLKLLISHKDILELNNNNIQTLEQKNTNLFNLAHSLSYSTDITKFI